LYNDCLQEIERLEEDGKIRVIRPAAALPAKRLTRDRRRIVASLVSGRQAARQWLRDH
jgi:predicted patatin/cPLA2 family phospholipase